MKEWGVNWWEINDPQQKSAAAARAGVHKPGDNTRAAFSPITTNVSPLSEQQRSSPSSQLQFQTQLQDSIMRMYLPQNSAMREALSMPLRRLDGNTAELLAKHEPLTQTNIRLINRLALELRQENERLRGLVELQESSIEDERHEEFKGLSLQDMIGELEEGSPTRARGRDLNPWDTPQSSTRLGHSPGSPRSPTLTKTHTDSLDNFLLSPDHPMIQLEEIYPSWRNPHRVMTNAHFSPPSNFRKSSFPANDNSPDQPQAPVQMQTRVTAQNQNQNHSRAHAPSTINITAENSFQTEVRMINSSGKDYDRHRLRDQLSPAPDNPLTGSRARPMPSPLFPATVSALTSSIGPAFTSSSPTTTMRSIMTNPEIVRARSENPASRLQSLSLAQSQSQPKSQPQSQPSVRVRAPLAGAAGRIAPKRYQSQTKASTMKQQSEDDQV